MTDFLHPKLDDAGLGRVSALGLAHIGDGVYEIMTRSYLVCQGMQTARGLHSKTYRSCARAHSTAPRSSSCRF